MQQVKFINDCCDIAVIHKGNRGLVRGLREIRNTRQLPEITGNRCFGGKADLFITAFP